MKKYLNNILSYLAVSVMGFCTSFVESLYALGVCIMGVVISMMIMITILEVIKWVVNIIKNKIIVRKVV